LLAQLVQGEVGLPADELLQASGGLFVQDGRLSPAVGAWLKGAGLSPQAQQAYDEGEADAEAQRQLPQGSLLVFNGIGYPFA